MSWATCNNGSNPIHKNLPPLMSDGRLYTNLDPHCEQNDKLKRFLKIENNYDYRQHLINNAGSLMNQNRMACFMTNNNTKVGEEGYVHHNKYIFNGVHDNSQPFGHQNSDLKNLYLSRQQLADRKEAPIIKLK
tara:strand:- start:176 stop:574 length:399 start_codon:yes stop_codon:yes gene_type:complete